VGVLREESGDGFTAAAAVGERDFGLHRGGPPGSYGSGPGMPGPYGNAVELAAHLGDGRPVALRLLRDVGAQAAFGAVQGFGTGEQGFGGAEERVPVVGDFARRVRERSVDFIPER